MSETLTLEVLQQAVAGHAVVFGLGLFEPVTTFQTF